MNLPSILLWGFLATMVLTSTMAASQGLGLSRMGLPFILGTMFTPDRGKAKVLGFGLHLINGWLFALVYALIFESVDRTGWLLGAGLGFCHGLVVLLAFMPLIPGVHPRMATEQDGPDPTRALEPPGFLALNYGRRTPLIALLAHTMYGLILGAFYHLGH